MATGREEPIRLADGFPFQILEEVGAGATSEVFRARELRTGRLVALKIGKDVYARTTFADEAERIARVHSPLFPELIDVGIVPETTAGRAGAPYLALSWIDGRALDVRISRSPEERHALALAVLRDIGNALAALHEAGVAHGDVKPANILIGRGADASIEARLVDLGLSGDADMRTPTGGTIRYLPQETWSSADAGDGRARDRLALGIVIAEILDPEVAHAHDALTTARRAKLPAPFDRIAPALLAQNPAARPRASWAAAQAEYALGLAGQPSAPEKPFRYRVRATYLQSRHAEIAQTARCEDAEIRVSGEPLLWLDRAIDLGRKCARLRGEALVARKVVVGDADDLARARWLVGLTGSAAASWPLCAFADRGDAAWAEAFLTLADERDPSGWELGTVERALAGDSPLSPRPYAKDLDPTARAASLALALAASPPDRAAIEEIERNPHPPELARAAADALRRLGENGRALALLQGDDSIEGLAIHADAARRAGELSLASRLAEEALAKSPSHDGASAVLARIRLDALDLEGAERALDRATSSAKTAEARALIALARGEREAATHEISRGEALANDDEARARLAGLFGYVAHARGDARRAAEAFGRAGEHAARASALVEEATYRTGQAAAATDRGDIGTALAASRRASLLWEHLNRPADAARALLARAASFALVGARQEALAAALEGRERARLAGDRRAEAFAHWPVTDVLEAGAPDAIEAARQAMELLDRGGNEKAADEDRLRALARLLRHGASEITADSLAWGDDLASRDACVASARLEWWGARAASKAEGRFFGRPESVVREVVRLADAPASIASRGPALFSAAKLAAQIGDGDAVRLLVRAQSEAARTLKRLAPPEFRETLRALPWVRDASALAAPGVSAEQLTDIENLVRALGTRDRLRPLLEQVLDSLVLWTGVERGLLLLVAPGDRLVPRVARNLQRADLEGEQRALSQTLARRALSLREPVVAVDASGELSNVHESVMALKLRSVLAVPLIARGEALGVVYLDDRIRRGAFGPKELSWVRLVASIAAVAIADARDQLLLRRAVRKAERARKQLSRELVEKEAALEVATRELSQSQESKSMRYRYPAIVGKSEPVRAMLSLVDRVTPTSVPVLLIGESGSGKELVARALHENGPRSKQTFVGENCGAIPETLLESTLFGHVRGAFTGADRPRAGLFEIADKGTLFLDEIGEMPLTMQTKLLRVLETGEVRPLGGERGRRVDVRIIAATHRDLRQMVNDGRFREDLFYRLDVMTIRIPPLRERADDIPLLVSHLVAKHSKETRVRISKEASLLLSAYPWPGNVRQLENEVRRALVLSDGVILPEHLSREVCEGGTSQRERELGFNLRARVDALSTELLRDALLRTKGNQTRAAELLGLSRFGLQKMLKRLEIEV